MEDPRRTFSTSVLVPGGDFLEASVRLTKPVPLSKVFDVMEEIKKVKLKPPLEIGDVILTNPAGTETEVVITRNVIARRTS
jgi:CxxC motif-containing protein